MAPVIPLGITRAYSFRLEASGLVLPRRLKLPGLCFRQSPDYQTTGAQAARGALGTLSEAQARRTQIGEWAIGAIGNTIGGSRGVTIS